MFLSLINSLINSPLNHGVFSLIELLMISHLQNSLTVLGKIVEKIYNLFSIRLFILQNNTSFGLITVFLFICILWTLHRFLFEQIL